MAQELIYTSAEHGLRPGTRGFCTVAHTSGMSPQQVQLLEALSTYRSAYTVLEENEGCESPVSWSHCRINLLGRSASVLSRISNATADHTNRSNKIAHHLLIPQREHPDGGPAWLCSEGNLFVEDWTEEPHLIPEPCILPVGDEQEFRASSWEDVTGDGGHAWTLASSFIADPNRITVLVFKSGMPMLDLIREALRLMPADWRWQVTFNTYFTGQSAGATCAWRCCLENSDELRRLRNNPRVRIMDLTVELPAPTSSPQVELARTGTGPGPLTKETDDERNQGNGVPFKLMSRGKINQITLRPRF